MLENFTVIDLVQTPSASFVTFIGSAVKFNIQTAAELQYAGHVQFLVNAKDKQFAIRACEQEKPNAIRFSKPKGEQIYQIKIGCAPAVDLVRKIAGWEPNETWNVPGVYYAKEKALIYDLTAAYRPKTRAKKTSTHSTSAGS